MSTFKDHAQVEVSPASVWVWEWPNGQRCANCRYFQYPTQSACQQAHADATKGQAVQETAAPADGVDAMLARLVGPHP
jgi:hypothetical protein